MRKKIGTITFHSSYNHGSVLQAYALQEFIKKEFDNNFDYKIINLRTKRQKKYYDRSYTIFNIKNDIKKILLAKYRSQMLLRKKRYEYFINNKLSLTSEYSDLNDLKNANLDFDYYVSGSDQIWKPTILDFDWSFFLEFAKNGKKISYAASFGPEELELDKTTEERLRRDLADYEGVSVREVKSAEKIKQIIGKDIANIHIDPTLLLNKNDWDKIIGGRMIKNDYILLYDLKENRDAYEISYRLSKILNIPVIVIKENIRMHFLYKDFERKYDAGPIEFLNYIKYAKAVISSSFHGNVFSIIFRKPFLAVGGKEDFRINNLLELTSLTDRAIKNLDELEIDKLFDIDFSGAELAINKERARSKEYFTTAFEIGDKNE